MKTVESTLEALHAMVDSLGQGLFLFSKDGQCSAIYSQACETLFETIPKGRCITEVLKIPAEKRAGFLDWCSLLFEEVIDFEELALLGPQLFTHSKDRVVALEYKPVRNKTGQIEAVVVIATDRTHEVETQKKADELQAYATMVVSILKDRSRFAQFVRHAREFFKEIEVLLAAGRLSEDALTVIKRHLHTLKGAASIFGLMQIQNCIHHIETELTSHHGEIPMKQFLIKSTTGLEDIFEGLLNEHKEVIGDIFQGAGATREVSVSLLDEFARNLQDSDCPPALYQNFVEDILCVPLWDNFAQFNPVVEATAKVTGKSVGPVICVGDNPRIYPEAYEHLWESLGHLFRNLVDHGIEEPAQRKAIGKPKYGEIIVRCSEITTSVGQRLEIRISDDGKGVDPEAIRRKLILNGNNEAHSLSEAQLIDRIFIPGFSTAKTVTEISGRGVGMDAVRSSVEALHGTISAESIIGKGTTFCLTLPLLKAASNP